MERRMEAFKLHTVYITEHLDKWVTPVKSFLSFKRVGLTFLVLYVVFVVIALKVLGREQLSTPVPGTFVRHTYSFKPKMPVSNHTSTACQATEDEALKPYFHRLDDQTFFLNAFFDQRQGSHIRVLSMRRNFASEVRWNQVYCLVNSAVNHSLMVVPAEAHPLHDNNDNIYGGYILSCNVRGIIFENPCKVRLSHYKVLDDRTVTVPTVTLQEKYFNRASFGICTPPIYGVITQNQLVEFIELNRLFGAEHFFFYQYQGHPEEQYNNPNINQVLKFYKDAGLVTIFPWRLPVNPEYNVWGYGKALAIQHCLYANMWKYSHLAFTDIDEYIVPHNTPSWTAMIEDIDNGVSSGYCAQSAFFPPEVTAPLRVLESMRRTENVDTKHIKCLVRPERLLEMGSEGIIKGMDEHWPMSIVDPEVALVHHYKWCTTESGFHNCFDYVMDKCMTRYEQTLRENYRDAILRIAGYKLTAIDA